jgi:hypothetical protein
MANPNPLAGVVPQVVHPVNDGETTISKYVEKIEGEVVLDIYVKAQASAPEIVKRITELENALWRLADAVSAAGNIDENPKLRAAVVEAEVVLKNRLEIDESKHRFHSELGVSKDGFKDDLRLFKD